MAKQNHTPLERELIAALQAIMDSMQDADGKHRSAFEWINCGPAIEAFAKGRAVLAKAHEA